MADIPDNKHSSPMALALVCLVLLWGLGCHCSEMLADAVVHADVTAVHHGAAVVPLDHCCSTPAGVSMAPRTLVTAARAPVPQPAAVGDVLISAFDAEPDARDLVFAPRPPGLARPPYSLLGWPHAPPA